MVNSNAEANKQMLLTDLHAARQEILDALAGLPVERFDEVFLGEWSALDLLAHLVGWDYTNLKAAQDILAGQLPAFYEYRDAGWRSYNTRLVTLYKRSDPVEMVEAMQASHGKLMALLETIAPEDFGKDTGVRYKGIRVTIERLLKTEIEDEREHAQQIRDFTQG